MNEFAIIIFWILFGLIVGQGFLVASFVVTLWKWKRALVPDSEAKKAAVILALRGGDPFLIDCLHGLLNQDYPEYRILIMIDHPDDPALQLVQQALEQTPSDNVEIQFLENRLETCSLKCSSIVQAVQSLDDSIHFIAQLDADTIPHKTWLRELATALQDEKVGAATGNRWYMPENPSLGAFVRYFWNAAAVVQMVSYKIAWGGTLAVKTSLFKETDLLEQWSKAFCEDTMLYAHLKKSNLEVAFVPSLLMVNREDCTLGSFFPWVQRQLLTARLYHPFWFAVLAHGIITTLLPVLALALGVYGLFAQQWPIVWWSFGGILFYEAMALLMIAPMEIAARRIVSGRGEPTNWSSKVGVLKWISVLLSTQVVYAFALGLSSRMRKVSWRGIHYKINDRWDIVRENYEPYEKSSEEQNNEKSSL